MRLSQSQKAMLIKLWNAPGKALPCKELHKTIAQALIRKGYVETFAMYGKPYYALSLPGVRYNQTGKQIGE